MIVVLRWIITQATAVTVIAFGVTAGLAAPAARAIEPAPSLAIVSEARPTNISPESGGRVFLLITNDGGAATSGQPLTVTDVLPPDLNVVSVEARVSPSLEKVECTSAGSTVNCTYFGILSASNTDGLNVDIEVTPEAGVFGVLMPDNVANVSGGGAGTASTRNAVNVGTQEPGAGFGSPFSAYALDPAGSVDTQAGGHPSIGETGFTVNTVAHLGLEPGFPTEVLTDPVQDIRDVTVTEPPGLVGDPEAAPTCPETLVAPPNNGKTCPGASIVGSVAITHGGVGVWEFSGPVSGESNAKPIFNVTPERGHPAQFAFIFENQEITLYVDVVHSAAGYVIQVRSVDIPRAIVTAGVKVTLFGDPAVADGTGGVPTAFFTDPSDCNGGPLITSIDMDSWQSSGEVEADGEPNLGDPAWQTAESVSPAPTGCTRLAFAPEFEARPSSDATGAPSGLVADLRVPQDPDPSGLATPDVKDVKVALPHGLVVDPSSAGGLAACSDDQFGVDSTEVSACPEGSQLGTVVVHTPILANSLEGQVFLGSPECDPCTEAAGDPQSGRMVRLFVQVHSDEYGVTVKIPGSVSVDPVSGQLVASFKDLPQLPFDNLKFNFKSGPRAPLATPSACGSYSTTADFTPWSTPYTKDAVAEPGFAISEGCGGHGFAPEFVAGTTSNQAAAFSPFTATFSRPDGNQDLSLLQVKTPPGLLALLSRVPLCGEAQANAGTCPTASEIGHTTVEAGVGSEPLTVPEAGQPPAPVFLTGSYKGAPFGLSVVVPAVAGPFNLGKVIVRAAISVDPHTGQATITSDRLPQILDGIPLQVRSVNVTIDRPGFIFNPTSCNAVAVSSTLGSSEGASATGSSRFQAASCAGLPFKPRLSAAVAGHASKAAGASIDVKVSAKGGPQAGGGEANIKGVKVDLPKQLPSRLSTLQRACLAAVFAANPAACPKESDVGTATAMTPVLAHSLSGPAYLVSYGSEKFPDLEIVLQGEGVVLVLDGLTNIKKGITSSNFDTVPDAPISSFELKLPTGRFSVLGTYLPEKAKYDLCGQSLAMPTMITAQNGAVLKQTTKISVTGCPKPKKATKKPPKKKATK